MKTPCRLSFQDYLHILLYPTFSLQLLVCPASRQEDLALYVAAFGCAWLPTHKDEHYKS